MSKYFARDTLLIETTGLSVEIDLEIVYSVSRYRAATLTQPEELRSVEIESIKPMLNGTPVYLSGWIDDAICNDEFKARLLEDAADKDAAAAEDAAEDRREMLRAAE